MTLKNTFRLTFSNSHLIFKVLIYYIICGLIIAGITVACTLPFIQKLIANGFFSQIGQLFNSAAFTVNLSAIMQNTAGILDSLINIISANIADILWLVILAFFILFIFGQFVLGFCDLAVNECIYSYMGSNMRVSFTAGLIGNFKKALKLQAVRLLVFFPVDALIALTMFFSLELFSLGSVMAALAPTLIILILTILLSLRLTLFSCWNSSVVVNNSGIFRGLKKGINLAFSRFFKIYLSALALTIVLIILNVICLIFTAGVGLLLSIPITAVVINIYGSVVFFENRGLRFYVDSGTIIAPLKVEDYDKIKKVKEVV